MDGPGSITWEEFVDNAEELVRSSDLLADHWELLGDKETPGQAYLMRREKTFVPIDYPIDDSHREPQDELELELGLGLGLGLGRDTATGTVGADSRPDEEWSKKFPVCADPFEASSARERPLITEHHVLWSMSYAVPVIYFNGWKFDYPGVNPVSVEVAQRLAMKEKLAYAELSQAIHPILGKPYLHLHPCGSQHLLQSMSKSTNKVVSWLSAVAPAALNLRLRPEYFRMTNGGDTRSKANETDGPRQG